MALSEHLFPEPANRVGTKRLDPGLGRGHSDLGDGAQRHRCMACARNLALGIHQRGPGSGPDPSAGPRGASPPSPPRSRPPAPGETSGPRCLTVWTPGPRGGRRQKTRAQTPSRAVATKAKNGAAVLKKRVSHWRPTEDAVRAGNAIFRSDAQLATLRASGGCNGWTYAPGGRCVAATDRAGAPSSSRPRGGVTPGGCSRARSPASARSAASWG